MMKSHLEFIWSVDDGAHKHENKKEKPKINERKRKRLSIWRIKDIILAVVKYKSFRHSPAMIYSW